MFTPKNPINRKLIFPDFFGLLPKNDGSNLVTDGQTDRLGFPHPPHWSSKAFEAFFRNFVIFAEDCQMILEIIATIISVALAAYFYLKNKRKNLPPANPDSILKTLSMFTSTQLPYHLVKWSKDVGPVYAANLPEFNPIIMISDVDIAKLLLEGDREKGIRQGEKLPRIKRMIPNNVPWLINRYTYGDNWDLSRYDMIFQRVSPLHYLLMLLRNTTLLIYSAESYVNIINGEKQLSNIY